MLKSKQENGKNSFIRQRCAKEKKPNIVMNCQICSTSFFSPILSTRIVKRIVQQQTKIYKLCEKCDVDYCVKTLLVTCDFDDWLLS